MKQAIGLFFFIVTVTAILVNGSVMLVSPKLWFSHAAVDSIEYSS
jgi:hypothetical protein